MSSLSPRGMKLFLKGAKCFSEKCPIEKRNYAPGQHGKGPQGQDRRLRVCSCARSRRPSALLHAGKNNSAITLRRPPAPRASPAKAAATAGDASRQRRLSHGLCHLAPSGAAVGAPRPHRRQRQEGEHPFVSGRERAGSFRARSQPQAGHDRGRARNFPAISLRRIGWAWDRAA